MPEAQRLVLLGLTFGVVVVLLGFAETWMVGGPALVRSWFVRVPEAAAIVVAASLVAVFASGALGPGSTYVVLGGSAAALYRVRLPEARRSLTPSRAIVLLLGGVGAMVVVGLIVAALAGVPPA